MPGGFAPRSRMADVLAWTDAVCETGSPRSGSEDGRGVTTIAEAAGQGAGLVVVPETLLPGYPAWTWSRRPAEDHALCSEIHRPLLAGSIDLDADDLAPAASGRPAPG